MAALIDANVFMYVVGAEHPHKAGSARLVEAAIARRVAVVMDAEVLQEILHRYQGERMRLFRETAYGLARASCDRVIPVDAEVTDGARALMSQYPSLSARDALHIAVCKVHFIDSICSYDTDFDVAREVVRRVEPGMLVA